MHLEQNLRYWNLSFESQTARGVLSSEKCKYSVIKVTCNLPYYHWRLCSWFYISKTSWFRQTSGVINRSLNVSCFSIRLSLCLHSCLLETCISHFPYVIVPAVLNLVTISRKKVACTSVWSYENLIHSFIILIVSTFV